MRILKPLFATAALAAAIAAAPAQAADITGAGATFPYPIYAKWADAYKKSSGTGLNYQSIGSGGGIKQITAKTVDFGASDMPLSADDLEKNGLIQFPAVMGGNVPVYNLKGVTAPLKFTGELLADIYLGKVKTWNDPAIQSLNKEVKLPADAISVVYRSDGSGTTFILMHRVQDKPENAKEVLKFFDWAYANGDDMATQLDYVALPDPVVKLVKDLWKRSIKDKNGTALY